MQFVPNSSSSLLRPGSRFKGSQTSDRQQYEVDVEIKHVDMRESFVCGYLRIQGVYTSLYHGRFTWMSKLTRQQGLLTTIPV